MKIKGGLLEAGEGGKMRKTKSIIYRLIEQSKLLKVIFKKRENRKRMGQPPLRVESQRVPVCSHNNQLFVWRQPRMTL